MAASRPRPIIQHSKLIWADAYVHASDPHTKDTLDRLFEIVPSIELVQSCERCIEVLNGAEPTKCYLIISGAFGECLVPHIHSSSHLEAIFVFCSNKSYHEGWTKRWNKIQGVFTFIDSICDQLRPILKQRKNYDIAMSIIASEKSDQIDPKQLPPSFLYSSMLKEVFLDSNFNQKHIDKMIKMLTTRNSDNATRIRLIKEFAEDQRENTAIWWYTRSTFAYEELNQCLRTLDAEMIVDMAPFIVDLHRQIKQLYEKQLNSFGRKPFTHYRGQGMTEEAFRQLSQSKNGLLSFDCFLSTSKQREVSLGFAEGGSSRAGHVGVLFVIEIDPSLRVAPFAHIKDYSYFPDEDEVLFGMHSIFKIGQVQPLTGHTNLYEVRLQLTDEDDPKLLGLKKHMAREARGSAESRLGRTLIDMGEHDKAEEVYLELLEKETNERDKGVWNHELGRIKGGQGRYQEAIEYYQKALEIFRRVLSGDDPKIAATYSAIGAAYHNMGGYSEALDNYTKAVKIQEKVLPENDADLAISYNNIGSVYKEMGEKHLHIMKNHLRFTRKHYQKITLS